MSQNPYAPPKYVPPTFSHTANGELELASLGQRFAGAFLDGLIMLAIVFPLGFGLGFALVLSGMDPEGVQFSVLTTVVGAAIGIGVFLALNGYLLASRGQTIGKYVLGTQIQSDDGQLMPFGSLILKRYVPLWVVSHIPWVGGIVSLVNALVIFRANRKCLHDEIAGTKVVVLRQ
ncbi:MAG: RDD family protein [Pirellulaceae bacterium]|nr:RDD family protein [Pirellulaceae bacterium]